MLLLVLKLEEVMDVALCGGGGGMEDSGFVLGTHLVQILCVYFHQSFNQ